MPTLCNPTHASYLAGREGVPVEVIRQLWADEADPEVGPMYAVRLPSGRVLHVFADELDPQPTEERG